MCLLIYKPAGVIVSKDRLLNGFTHNQDGAGFALCEQDKEGKPELNIYKGLFEWKEFWKEWEPRQDKQAVVHFRDASPRQAITGENTHPFRVLPSPNDLVMAHNGYIYGLPQDNINKYSDTAIFAEMVLMPLAKKHFDFWLMPEFKWFIEHSIGSNNKLVMMDIQGRFNIFNEGQGKWVDETWFSNNDYNYRNYLWVEDDDDLDAEYENLDNASNYGVRSVDLHGPARDDTVIDVEVEVEEARQTQQTEQKKDFKVQKDFSRFTTFELNVLDKIIEKENAAR